jgi:type III pantothenate kinase
MTLLLDLGNTRLKCARLDGAAATPAEAFAHADADFDDAFARWLRRSGTDARVAWLAAVAPDPIVARVATALTTHGVAVKRVVPQAFAHGVRVAYAQPQALGVDRWLGLVAAHARGGAWLVVGAGTALTLDALLADGRHRGGLIAPPPDVMRAALVARAPRLAGTGGAVLRFAADTADAIASGCTLAAVALVERSLATLREEAPDAGLLLAGGGAGVLTPWLPAHERVPALVLEGLARVAAAAAPLESPPA